MAWLAISKEVVKMVYQWKISQPVSAETAGKEFERLEQKHGHISPKLVLDESRSEKAPLHKCFEWNDNVAAEKYRLSQAGLLIRSLTVIIDEHEQTEPVRAYVNVVPEAPARRGEFINITSALKDSEMRDVTLGNALRELKEFEKKYKHLTELSALFSEVDKLKNIA
jgi:hypothetical protein